MVNPFVRNVNDFEVSWFSVTSFFENYGWYLLCASIVLAYLYSKFQDKIQTYLKKREDAQYSAKYHKDPDLFIQRLNEQQTLLDKLQERYNRDAEAYKKKMEEREAKRRQELLEKLNASNTGRKLGSSEEKPKSFRPEYNPLMGSGGTNYRPQRKTPCSGGGCGR